MTASIDATAFARLALFPLVLATALLVGLWWRQSLRARSPLAQLAAITSLTLFLCFDLVAFGAYTRLTDSGLGCPDWPGCYEQASPVGAASPISNEEAARPEGPVTERKAWIEMLHRYFAGTLGLLVAAMAVLAWRARRERQSAFTWVLLTLAWFVVQALFGALTVTWKLYPAVVTGHLLGGIGLVALIAWQRALYRRSDADEARAAGRPSSNLWRWQADRRVLTFAALVLVAQIALGGWVSTNTAVLACASFPSCNGPWWPAMHWLEGFTLMHPLHLRADGSPMSPEALVAIHWTHRLFAIVAFVTLGGVALRFRHRAAARPIAAVLGALLVLQVLTGISNVVLRWPLSVALAHTAGAAALVVALCALASHLRDRDARDASST